MGRSSHPIRHDPLAFPVEWIGKSKLLHNWSKATANVYFDFGDGILWRLDSFEPDKTIYVEDENPTRSNTDAQGELFAESKIIGKRLRKINLGVFTPVRVDNFVEFCKKGESVQGGFGLDDLGIFEKEFVLVDTVGSRVLDKT